MATLAMEEAAAPDLDDLLSEQAINDPDSFCRRLRDDAPVRTAGAKRATRHQGTP